MKLKVGDKVPNFVAKDSFGNDFDIQNYLGKKTLVIYFYPKDNTHGCTIEACSFRDQYQNFKDEGAEVIGISSDGIESHQKFSTQYQLPFILLSDSDKKISTLFGVSKKILGIFSNRVTYVIDKKGIVKMIYKSNLAFKKHISKALKAVKNIAT